MSKIVDFTIMKINRNSQKICKCNPPKYEIDTTNRLVQCKKCNAYIQPFDAMVHIAEVGEKLNQEMHALIEMRNVYAEEVNELQVKRFRLNHFRNLQSNYMSGLMPHCPHCQKVFDPTEIDSYAHKNYCDYKKKDD